MRQILFLFFSLLFATRIDAGMVRVVEIRDGSTLVVESDGRREVLRLAGIAITDDFRAAELLRWTTAAGWVLAEPRPTGGHYVYRSPDAVFLNRELVLRGYARATEHGIEPAPNVIVTYLGIVDPAARPTAAGPPRTDSGTRPRSSVAPRRGTRTRGATSSRRRGSPSRNP
jgi:hypothetical protein